MGWPPVANRSVILSSDCCSLALIALVNSFSFSTDCGELSSVLSWALHVLVFAVQLD